MDYSSLASHQFQKQTISFIFVQIYTSGKEKLCSIFQLFFFYPFLQTLLQFLQSVELACYLFFVFIVAMEELVIQKFLQLGEEVIITRREVWTVRWVRHDNPPKVPGFDRRHETGRYWEDLRFELSQCSSLSHSRTTQHM